MSGQLSQASPSATPVPQFLVGVDIASQKFMVAVFKLDKTITLKPLEFDNSLTGFEKLCAQFDQLGLVPAHTLVGMEATARYWENLYHYLSRHGYQLILLQPAHTHQWAANRGLRAKTDRLDSLTIARHLLAEDARSYLFDRVKRTISLVHVQQQRQKRNRAIIPVFVPEFFNRYLGKEWQTDSADLIYRKGSFWLYIVVSTDKADTTPTDKAIGVDLGSSRIAVTSKRNFFGGKAKKEVNNRYFRLRRSLQAKGTKSAKRYL
ncbi:MAG: transposase [Chloroflexi bacterium]|uniref:Transposase n=1 Tax=Candidatus Chlorohelix allophototropha TaxID=3003348 RepID=A0A8T7M4T1_9CHLR|nr:transposase [Chloroflexota bacterium]WJW70380.1 IS110 family transposase [Chloroflexota bacterium L227-S17]